MIVFIHADGRAELREPGTLNKFRVDIDAGRTTLGAITDKSASLLSFEDDATAWVDLAALFTLSGAPQDRMWRDDVHAMIEKARPYGWVRDEPAPAIKAHVVWAD